MKPLCFAILLLSALHLLAAPTHSSQDVVGNLENAHSAVDSMRAYYELIDIAPADALPSVAEKGYRMAVKTGNESVALDILRFLSNVYETNDSATALILEQARLIRPTEEQRETVTYLQIVRARNRVNFINEHERANIITDLLQDIPEDTLLTFEDLNRQIVKVYTALNYLSRTTHRELMAECMSKMKDYIQQLPHPLPTLHRAFSRQAATIYTELEMPEEALIADRRLLDVMERMEALKRSRGRTFASYNHDRYEAMTRMIYNGRNILPRPTIDSLYSEIMKLVSIDPSVKEFYEKTRTADIVYYASNNNHQAILPLLKNYINNFKNSPYIKLMLRHMRDASRALGDMTTYREASDRYIDYLENQLQREHNDRRTDLNIVYNIASLRQRNIELELEKNRIQLQGSRRIDIAFIIVTPIMIILLTLLLIMFRRQRLTTSYLMHTNNQLAVERDNFLKQAHDLEKARKESRDSLRQRAEFLSNITHEISTPLNSITDYSRLIADCVDEKQRPYLEHYAQLIESNNKLIQKLVSDAIRIGATDNGTLRAEKEHISINHIIDGAMAAVAFKINPDVKVVINPHPDFIVNTDVHHATTVLINLLDNAAKFTDSGSITIDVEQPEGQNYASITVTDTGKGIPRGKADFIFERFAKLNNDSQGAGLGLSVARSLATLLGGNVELISRGGDRGASFRFTFSTI